ncbi:hypothetical protein MC885_001450 [Smutsia gigantea]|nr:hypothetical protein MC885_001450 [Smutsia gigantea]
MKGGPPYLKSLLHHLLAAESCYQRTEPSGPLIRAQDPRERVPRDQPLTLLQNLLEGPRREGARGRRGGGGRPSASGGRREPRRERRLPGSAGRSPSLSWWLSLIPTPIGASRRFPDWSRAGGRRDLKVPTWGPELPSQPHSEESSQIAFPITHRDTSGRAPTVWRLRASADPQCPPLPSTPDHSWVSHAMLSSRVGLGAACLTTEQGLWASWRCV